MIPGNDVGYQYARTGTGYAGIGLLTGYPNLTGAREYIEIKLSDTLIIGHNYLVEFYVSLGNSSGYNYLATDAIQAVLSDTIVYDFAWQVINLPPSISNPHGNIINDTLNWVRISGTYQAHGGESYLILGNFINTNDSCSVDTTGSAGGDASYYFIDDVAVFADSSASLQDNSVNSSYTLYPNPTSDKLNLEINSGVNSECHLKIFDASGRIVSEETFSISIGINERELSVSGLAEGVYFIDVSIDGRNAIGRIVKE
ncbi:MAG TPA: T9SS type A sorting domain-containing protein [Bacteroidia bacterium]|jgi:hypothetical protein|nr:T9SS type A sorting domain-containing protein [Bacteroidia bacterium]